MQLDRARYRAAMQRQLAAMPNLTIVEGSVDDFVIEEQPAASTTADGGGAASGEQRIPRVRGVRLADGRTLSCTSVVLTTGTFLRGKLLQGRSVQPGGRRSAGDGRTGAAAPAADDADAVEPAATTLATTLQRLGFPLGRMRTGTPPRLARASLDLSGLTPQPSEPVRPFSFVNEPREAREGPYVNPLPLVHCWRTHTTEETRRWVQESVAQGHVPEYESKPILVRGAATAAAAAPLSGTGDADGLPARTNDDSNAPRYCPSLENKMTRFASRNSHHIVLEPEGLPPARADGADAGEEHPAQEEERFYPQGLEISSSPEYQERIVRSIPGLEKARLLALGYAVEFDFLDPRALHPSLESKLLGGLFLAGQINGSTGYAEAAAQGVLAGINAARFVQSQPALVLPRSSSLLAVLVSDLTSVGAVEPYRMFTSRAEHRLHLRADNADRRLTRIAVAVGAVEPDGERMDRLAVKEQRLARGMAALQRCRLPKALWNEISRRCTKDADPARLLELLQPLQPQLAAADAAAASGAVSAGAPTAAAFLEGAPLSCTLDLLCKLLPHSLGGTHAASTAPAANRGAPPSADVSAPSMADEASFVVVHPLIRPDLETDIRYAPFVARQEREVRQLGLEEARRDAATSMALSMNLATVHSAGAGSASLSSAAPLTAPSSSLSLPLLRHLNPAHFSHEDYDRLLSLMRSVDGGNDSHSAGTPPAAVAAASSVTLDQAKRAGLSPTALLRLVGMMEASNRAASQRNAARSQSPVGSCS
jgi:tRNA uridine 5-carboxymethylaminomethyl modification enzyme